MGYSPWGRKESDTTEKLSTARQRGLHVQSSESPLFTESKPVRFLYRDVQSLHWRRYRALFILTSIAKLGRISST